MGLHQNRNGIFDMCDSGLVRLSKCPGFDCRPIIYVDKHAAGNGDGSIWENAYADIQTAINAHPCKEIQIKGYGENDCYPSGINLIDCTYLKGVNTGSGDMWIDGENTQLYGISGYIDSSHYVKNTKIDSINIKGCDNNCIEYLEITEICNCNLIGIQLPVGYGYSGHGIAIIRYGTVSNCTAKILSSGFWGIENINISNCTSDLFGWGFRGLYNCNLIDCTANRNPESTYPGSTGFQRINNSSLINCTANNHTSGGSIPGYGFLACEGSTFINCVSTNNQISGFSGNMYSTFIDCISSNNQNCGYLNNIDSTFLNCTDLNNCLSGLAACTPGDTYYNCDEV